MNSDKFLDGLLLVIKGASAFVIAQWLALSVGPRTALTALVIFMFIDWLTGLGAAWINGEVNSEIGRKGFTRKLLTLLLILTVHIAEKACNIELNLELWGGTVYAINELISIVENMDRAGVWIPQTLVVALARVKGLGPRRATRSDVDALRDETRAAADTQLIATRKEIDALGSDKPGN